MNVFSTKKKIVKNLPGLSTLFCMWVGLSGIGCDSGERDLFGIGFNCENPFHDNYDACIASAAVTLSSTS